MAGQIIAILIVSYFFRNFLNTRTKFHYPNLNIFLFFVILIFNRAVPFKVSIDDRRQVGIGCSKIANLHSLPEFASILLECALTYSADFYLFIWNNSYVIYFNKLP